MVLGRWIQLKSRLEALPLKIKTALITALLFACGVAALVVYVSNTLEADYVTQIGQGQKTAALFAARMIDADVRVRRNALVAVAEHIKDLPDHTSRTLQSYLTDKHATGALFNRDVYMIWKDGVRIAEKPDRGSLGTSYKTTPYFEDVLSTRKPVIRVIMGRFARKPVLVIAVPILAADGSLLGALCATEVIEGDSFLNFDIRLQDGQSGGFHVVAKDQGVFAASTDPTRVLQKIPARGVNPLFDTRLEGYLGPGRVVDSRGVDIVSAAAMAETPNWLVVAFQPTAQAFVPLYAAKQRIYLGAALVIALLGLLTWLNLRRALLPLERAARKMGGIHSDPSQIEPLTVEGSAEIRLLLQNFNLLRSALQQRNQMLADERDSERQQQRQRVLELYQFLQEVVERLPFGLLVYDGSHRVVLHNQLLLQLLALPPDFFDKGDVFHTTLIRFKHGRGDFGDQPLDAIIKAYADSLNQRKPLRMERLYANGRSFEVLGQPLLNDHMVVTYTDITAHKEAEKLMQKARDMAETATLSKSQFLANMSHEIRTPMNGILGLAYVLGKMDIGNDAQTLVHRIEQTGRTLQSILNDILDFSKIEANQMVLEGSAFALTDVMDSVATIMLGDPSHPDVDVAIAPPPMRMRALVGDGFRLGQVLINLVGNAIKFTHQGHVRLEVSQVGSNASSVTLRFAVRDSGIGMSEAVMADIFKPFSQADASTTRKYGGTGLGLSISRKLIDLMGGQLTATSTLGQGSEFAFTLTFPFASEAMEVNHQLKNLDLLIADDSDISRDALKSTALSLGWNPTVVEGGEAALQQVSQRQQAGLEPVVLVLDWKMPDLDGLLVAKAVNESLQGAQGPIIILATAHSREDLLAQPESRYADAVLNKPVSASALYDAVAVAMIRRGTLAALPFKKGRARLKGVRMLVVDDSEVNREVARLIFEGEEALVSTVADGHESVHWLDTHADQVDIVVMDVQMPVMNGIEATRLIRADRRFARLPIVALSAGAFAQDRAVALAAGMNEHITKPMDVERAVALIVSVLQTGVAASPGTPATARPSQDLQTQPATQPEVRYAGLDVAAAVRVWRSEDKYQAFLRRFMEDYTSQTDAMAAMDAQALSAMVHKMAGAAGSLGLVDLGQSAKNFETASRRGGDLQAALADLRQHIATAWHSMRAYLDAARQGRESGFDSHATSQTASPPEGPAHAPSASLLEQLMDILATDNPQGSEEMIAMLVPSLTPTQSAALQGAIAHYRFRDAEALLQGIAAQHHIVLRATPW